MLVARTLGFVSRPLEVRSERGSDHCAPRRDVPPNEIAFSRRRSGAREASGAETGAKTLVKRTRPGGNGRGLEISPRWAGCADTARGAATEVSS